VARYGSDAGRGVGPSRTFFMRGHRVGEIREVN
jgi:hypothetical protein